jgi:hypothetical protein
MGILGPRPGQRQFLQGEVRLALISSARQRTIAAIPRTAMASATAARASMRASNASTSFCGISTKRLSTAAAEPLAPAPSVFGLRCFERPMSATVSD